VFDEASRCNTALQQRELDLLSKLNHKNVVKLIDKDEETVRLAESSQSALKLIDRK
jgi:hypothetical protein